MEFVVYAYEAMTNFVVGVADLSICVASIYQLNMLSNRSATK